jgi:hypothetical protein
MMKNNDIVEKIGVCDKRLSEINREVIKIARSVEFQQPIPLEEEEELKKYQHPGLYFIEVRSSNGHTLKDWIEKFEIYWMTSGEIIANTPKIYPKRINKQTQLLEWMPLYLGKSKNISERLMQHKNLRADSRTFALKLAARKNILLDYKFRVKILKIKVDNYDYIVTTLEHELRNQLNPICGRQ